MQDSDTTQLGNTANEADITKHFTLALILKRLERIEGSVLYVETHTFRPVVAIDDQRVERWRERQRQLLRGQSNCQYARIQSPYLERSEYLCSAGIADHILASRPAGATEFILCEKGTVSRGLLACYGWRSAKPVILDDNTQLPERLELERGKHSAVFALIDPYDLTRVDSRLFAHWLTGLDVATAERAPMLALVFNWREDQWPVVDGYTRVSCLSARYLKSGNPWLKLSIYANTHGLALVAGLLEEIGK